MVKVFGLGCSFMSDDVGTLRSRSFVDLFCERYGYEYTCLARPGATNWIIRLQIDEAIRRRPDLVVIGATSSDRMNIVMNPEGWRSPVKLKHIEYRGYHCSSEQNIDQREVFIVGDTLANLVEGPYIDIPEDKKRAVQTYIADLHDMGLQYNIDACVIRDGLQALQNSGIPFLFIPGPTNYFGWNYLGNNLWPKDEVQPWDMPCGTHGNNNHNPPEAHEQFADVLEKTVFDRKLLTR